MKKIGIFSMLLTILTFASVRAADVTLFHSPTCPHCHHAKDFLGNELVKEFNGIEIETINLASEENIEPFKAALKKCNYDKGYIPVIVVGDKCFQGYGKNMNDDIRDALTEKMKSEKKNDEPTTKPSTIKERTIAIKPVQKNSMTPLYILFGLLVLGFGFVLFRKKK